MVRGLKRPAAVPKAKGRQAKAKALAPPTARTYETDSSSCTPPASPRAAEAAPATSSRRKRLAFESSAMFKESALQDRSTYANIQASLLKHKQEEHDGHDDGELNSTEPKGDEAQHELHDDQPEPAADAQSEPEESLSRALSMEVELHEEADQSAELQTTQPEPTAEQSVEHLQPQLMIQPAESKGDSQVHEEGNVAFGIAAPADSTLVMTNAMPQAAGVEMTEHAAKESTTQVENEVQPNADADTDIDAAAPEVELASKEIESQPSQPPNDQPDAEDPKGQQESEEQARAGDHKSEISEWPEVILNPIGADPLVVQAASGLLLQLKYVVCAEQLAKRIATWPRDFFMASACSGTGAAEEAIHYFFAAIQEDPDLAEAALDLQLHVKFMVECKKFKQHFLRRVHSHFFENTTKLCHLFKDVTTPKLTCIEHSKKFDCDSEVFGEASDPIDVFVSGFSCKSFSGMNTSMSASARLLSQPSEEQKEKSCSYRTYHGTLSIINRARPKVVLMENVENINMGAASSLPTNLDIVLNDLRDLGYEAEAIRLETTKFGLPQRRVRYYFIAILKQDGMMPTADARLRTSINVLKELEFVLPGMEDFLLDNDHPDVIAELQRRQKDTEAAAGEGGGEDDDEGVGFLCLPLQ
ncbi:Modification methylase MspI (M.MspI) (Cytosine-specific methyltransferase MspI) [Durusdinium trenchii]|uniref:Modification methylase MspI (M.MspI) (Cytosine-specific methyltransferase MspI) n=1 Tax=Durusdinium trenchii TaxID=1381693 RepID=A0ABP0MUZ3_9DINO